MAISIECVTMTTEVSEHTEHRAFSNVTDRVETDYYRFWVFGRRICIADRQVTSENFVQKRLTAALDEDMDVTSSSREESVKVTVDGTPLMALDVDAVDEFTSKLRKLHHLDIMKVLIPSWLLVELSRIYINERIENRVKMFNDAGFVFVQNAKIVLTRGRFGPPEESEMALSVGNHFLDLAFVPHRFVRLSAGPNAASKPETVSWTPDWERFIEACVKNDEIRSIVEPLPEIANRYLVRSNYLESI